MEMQETSISLNVWLNSICWAEERSLNAMSLETQSQSDWEQIGFKITSPPHDKETEDGLDLS